MFEYIQCWDDAGILLLNFGLVWNQKFHNLVLKVKNMMVLISKFACVCVVLECTFSLNFTLNVKPLLKNLVSA